MDVRPSALPLFRFFTLCCWQSLVSHDSLLYRLFKLESTDFSNLSVSDAQKDCRASSFCTAVLSNRIFSYGSSGPGLPASPRTGARPLPGCSSHSGTAALSASSKNSELSAPHLHPGMIPIVPVPASNSFVP